MSVKMLWTRCPSSRYSYSTLSRRRHTRMTKFLVPLFGREIDVFNVVVVVGSKVFLRVSNLTHLLLPCCARRRRCCCMLSLQTSPIVVVCGGLLDIHLFEREHSIWEDNQLDWSMRCLWIWFLQSAGWLGDLLCEVCLEDNLRKVEQMRRTWCLKFIRLESTRNQYKINAVW